MQKTLTITIEITPKDIFTDIEFVYFQKRMA